MADCFADDFKGYGTNANFMLNGLYAQLDTGQAGLEEDPDPNIPGVVFSSPANPVASTRLRRVMPTAVTKAGMMFRMWMTHLPPTDVATLSFGFSNNSNTVQIQWSVDTTGRIVVRGTAFGTVLATSTNPVLVANAWNHIQFQVVASATVGTAELRVNGIPVIGLDPAIGLNTGTQYSQWRIDNANSTTGGPGFYFKDLYVWDGEGTQNNDFPGTQSVFGRTTVSDVVFPWTASTGATGWNLLDNSPPLDGTEYISAGNPPPAASQFGLTPLPADVTSVRTQIIQVRSRKVDGGDGTLQSGLVSGASTGLGADRPLTTAFTYYEDIFANDPATGNPWTPPAADASKLQTNRTS